MSVPDIRVAFTTIADGNLAMHTGEDSALVQQRRAGVAARLGTAAVHYINQVHSATVVSTERLLENPSVHGDALISAGEAIGILSADCVPVLLASGDGTRIAAVHAGRQGLLAGVIDTTVRQLGSTTGMRAWIGPAICAQCYEVPEQLAQESEARMPGIRAKTSWGTNSLDLPGAVRASLESWGIEQITDSPACTLEEHEYFSYRRGNTVERIASIIWREQGSGDE